MCSKLFTTIALSIAIFALASVNGQRRPGQQQAQQLPPQQQQQPEQLGGQPAGAAVEIDPQEQVNACFTLAQRYRECIQQESVKETDAQLVGDAKCYRIASRACKAALDPFVAKNECRRNRTVFTPEWNEEMNRCHANSMYRAILFGDRLTQLQPQGPPPSPEQQHAAAQAAHAAEEQGTTGNKPNPLSSCLNDPKYQRCMEQHIRTQQQAIAEKHQRMQQEGQVPPCYEIAVSMAQWRCPQQPDHAFLCHCRCVLGEQAKVDCGYEADEVMDCTKVCPPIPSLNGTDTATANEETAVVPVEVIPQA